MAVAVSIMEPGFELGLLSDDDPLAWLASWWRGMPPDPAVPFHWWLGLLSGEPAGFAALACAPVRPGGYAAGLVHVRTSARRNSLGSVLRGAVEDVARGVVPGVSYVCAEADTGAVAAVDAWGLKRSATRTESVLDLTALDRPALESLTLVPGLTLERLPPLPELSDESWRDLHAFVEDRFREVPDLSEHAPMPYGMFRDSLLESGALLNARLGSERVGITMVVDRPGEPDARNTYLTGVVESARHRGIATALKARQALVLSDTGIRRLWTQSRTDNTPIVAANRALGFVPEATYCDVRVPLG